MADELVMLQTPAVRSTLTMKHHKLAANATQCMAAPPAGLVALAHALQLAPAPNALQDVAGRLCAMPAP